MYNCVVILGPTASGKTALSIKIAKLLSSEIVNADSMQIYKHLNIGTAKISEKEQQGVKHHMLDFVNPNEDFSVSRYRELAKPIIYDLIEKNKIPIIVGGTGFYVQSLFTQLDYGNVKEDKALREKLNYIAKVKGNYEVYNILKDLDSDSASKLHYNDLKRVIRAIEIFNSKNYNITLKNNTTQSTTQILLNPLYIVINRNRNELYKRIDLRVELMVEQGLFQEVEMLISGHLVTETSQCLQAIGYKEVYDFLKNKTTLEQTIEKIKQGTRNYAKRQITWFKKNKNATWFNLSCQTEDDIITFVKQNLTFL